MRVPRRWPEFAVEECRNRARRSAGWRALAGEFLEQEHEGGGRPAGDALHADLAGAVTGQVAGALAPGQLIGHWCGRRLGEFWVQEVAVAGEAAATRGWRDEDLRIELRPDAMQAVGA